MGRIHLFELEDQAWFPDFLRDAGTAYLELTQSINDLSEGIAAKLSPALRATGHGRIVDLCSGGTGPIRGVVERLGEEGLAVHLTVTDKFPNQTSFARIEEQLGERVACVPEPVDAMAVPRELGGLRTIFNALHHFRPADARKILQDAVDAGVPVASFEMVGRHPLYIVGLSFSWLMALVLVPFLRPFRPSWLVFTYLVPVIPLFILWDGMVSAFRTYSPEELQALVAELEGADAYEWEIGAEPLGGGPPAPVTYLIGTPRAA